MQNKEKKSKSNAEAAGRREFTLLACPHCGGMAAITGTQGVTATVKCCNCGCQTEGCGGGDSPEKRAATAWNKRACTEIEDLIMYADTAAKILRESGFPGKAEALESRYMKAANAIGFAG